jgi:hypothetical protein
MTRTNDDNQHDDAANTNGQIDDNTPPPITATAADDDPEFAGMNDRERSLVKKARGEEKRKLYKRQQEQEEQIRTLTRQVQQLRTAPPPATPAQAENRDDRIDNLLTSINRLAEAQTATNTRIEEMQQGEIRRRRESELKLYAAEQIADLRQSGEDLIEGLVGGDSEEDIDNSIKIANAEWKLTIQKHEAKQPRPNSGSPTSVTVQSGNGRRPAGTPPVQVANSVEAESNQETIDELTSNDAVRNGSYEKNRSKLFGTLKRNFKYTGNQPTS